MPVTTSMGRGGRRRRSSGLTMIELMIAITVALVLLAALAVMYGSSIQARNQIERTNRQIENGRYAIQLLRDDLQLAGFFGEFNMRDLSLPLPAVDLSSPDFCVTHLTAEADLPADGFTNEVIAGADRTGDAVVNGLDYLAAVMRIHVQGIDDVVTADLPACLSGADVREGTDVVVVRRLLTCAAGTANCAFSANAPYLQASQCDTQIQPGLAGDVFELMTGADATVFTRQDKRCNAAFPTPIRRYVTHLYFIANNNVAGDGVPTLKRRELLSAGFTTAALVEGIEDLQIEYGVDQNVDSDGNPIPFDGSPETYLDEPADAQIWSDVMTARVHLLSRSTLARTGYSDNNTYELGTKVIAAPGDAFTRQVFQSIVQFHNASGRRQ